jgi:hypothetical protein
MHVERERMVRLTPGLASGMSSTYHSTPIELMGAARIARVGGPEGLAEISRSA